MIRVSRSVLVVCCAVSLTGHFTALRGLTSENAIELEGGAPTQTAALGNSFADFVQGVTAPTPAEIEPLKDVQKQVVEPVVIEPLVEVSKPAPKLNSIAPEPLSKTPVIEKQISQTGPTTVMVTLVPKVTKSTFVATPKVPVLKPLPQETKTSKVKPPQKKLKASERKKPKKVEKPKPPKKQKKKKETAKPRKATQAKGNSQKSAKKGVAQGKKSGKQANTSKTGKRTTKKAGNAAVSNYPGQVLRCISRARKPRVGSKGTAIVRFKITSSGAVASVSIARSSGNAKLDKAAVLTVRRAGPCKAPPAGARRSFSIKIKGR